MTNPKVFISHASEDKKRFVLEFASKLTENGVDVWYDDWEIRPGDSLIKKIFDEGLKSSDIIIIVLSENSLNKNKRWFKEELDSAAFKRIEEDTKIIPIVIDKNVIVPTSIKHLKRIKISNLSDYITELEEIVSTIFEKELKPSIGNPPEYSKLIQPINGLTKIDTLVLKALGDLVLNFKATTRHVNGTGLFDELLKFDINKELGKDSLEILESQNFVNINITSDGEVAIIQLTSWGFVRYCENFYRGFNSTVKDIISSILNENLLENRDIASKKDVNIALVSGVLDYFNDMGFIHLLKFSDGTMRIFKIHATGKRSLRQIMEN